MKRAGPRRVGAPGRPRGDDIAALDAARRRRPAPRAPRRARRRPRRVDGLDVLGLVLDDGRDDASSASASAASSGSPSGAADERGLELVDLAGGVLELARARSSAVRLRSARGPGVLGPPGLALLGSLSVTGHERSSALAGLPVARVPPAPLAVLAQGDAIGVVALGLVGLVVAPLALLAGEGDSDAHVSAGHAGSSVVEEVFGRPTGPGQRKDPPRASQDRV